MSWLRRISLAALVCCACRPADSSGTGRPVSPSRPPSPGKDAAVAVDAPVDKTAPPRDADPVSGADAAATPEDTGAGMTIADAAPESDRPTPPPPADPASAVLTSRYDNSRTGWASTERTLTVANVDKAHFGLLFARAYQGAVYGQPLYVPGLRIGGSVHDVVFVATAANVVYAFDASDKNAAAPLWEKHLEGPMPLAGAYPTCADMKASGQAGVTSTPVIDLGAGRIFVMAKSADGTRLHALDLTTGDERLTPTTVSAPGFDSRMHLNRPGLLLLDGLVYAGFGSHCDDKPYHGWVFAFDAQTLEPRGVFNTTPGDSMGAVWQSGVGLYGDDRGVLFCTGNAGTPRFGPMNLAMSVVRLHAMGGGLMSPGHFTPANAAAINAKDQDLTAGVTGVPGTAVVVSGGKEGPIYVLDAVTLALRQTVAQTTRAGYGMHALTAWNGALGPMVFTWPTAGQLNAYTVAGDRLTLHASGGPVSDYPGGTITVSSNGATPDTGVLWINMPTLGDAWHATAAGILRAFAASDVTKELWNSDMDPADKLGNYAKFSPPLVAGGKVYQATFSGKLMVYGLRP